MFPILSASTHLAYLCRVKRKCVFEHARNAQNKIILRIWQFHEAFAVHWYILSCQRCFKAKKKSVLSVTLPNLIFLAKPCMLLYFFF